MIRKAVWVRALALAAASLATAMVAPSVAGAVTVGGTFDDLFGGDGLVFRDLGQATDQASAVAVQADGKVVTAAMTNTDDRVHLLRYRNDGTPDPKFGKGGRAKLKLGGTDTFVGDLVIANNGKITVVGSLTRAGLRDAAVARFTKSGKPDKSFSRDGKTLVDFGTGQDTATSVALDGAKTVVAGRAGSISDPAGTDMAVARLTKSGKFDPTFNGGLRVLNVGGGPSDDDASAVLVDGGGRITLGGFSDPALGPDTGTDFTLVRLLTDSNLDPAFDGDSGTGNGIVQAPVAPTTGFDSISDIAFASGPTLVAAGRIGGGAVSDSAVARFDAETGVLDDSFTGDGTQVTAFGAGGPDEYLAVASEPGGRTVVVGSADADPSGATQPDSLVARYDQVGALDATFDGESGSANGGFVQELGTDGLDVLSDVALHRDGKLAVAGLADQDPTGTNRDALTARFQAGGPAIALSGPASTKDKTPTFDLDSDEPAAAYACDIDGDNVACAPPSVTPIAPLALGRHRLTVVAVGGGAEGFAFRDFTITK